MRTLALIGLLASSTTALAGVDSFVGSVDEVILSGTVEVPLVGDPSGETLDAMVVMTAAKEGEDDIAQMREELDDMRAKLDQLLNKKT